MSDDDALRLEAARTVTTIGYQGVTLAPFLEAVRRSGVDLLVDVRQRPSSRKRGFSKTPLAAALAAIGVEYEHLRALGTPTSLRQARRTGLPWDAFARSYRLHLSGELAALEHLAERVRLRPTALLCYEADALVCHRAILAEALRESGAVQAVRHLAVGSGAVRR